MTEISAIDEFTFPAGDTPLTNNTKQDVTATATTTIDLDSGNVIILTHNVDITDLSFSNVPDTGEWLIYRLAGSSDSIVWDSSIKWESDTPPTISLVSNYLYRFTKAGSGQDIVARQDFSEANLNYQLSIGANDAEDIYTWNNFDGSQLDHPASQPNGAVQEIAYSNNGLWLATANNSSPYINIYDVEAGFVKESNPASLPGGTASGVAFSPDNNYLAVCYQSSSPYLKVYNVGTWTLVTTSITLGTNAHSVAFSADSSMMAVTTNDGIFVYDTATWTVFSQVGGQPTDATKGCAFSPDGTEVSCVNDSAPRYDRYTISGTTITKQSSPASLPGSQCERIRYSNDGTLIAIAILSSPYIFIYDTSDMSKVADPSTLPSNAGNDVAFSPDDIELMVVTAGTPPYRRYQVSDWTDLAGLASMTTGSGLAVAYNPVVK